VSIKYGRLPLPPKGELKLLSSILLFSVLFITNEFEESILI
jgi:hypothetical protein